MRRLLHDSKVAEASSLCSSGRMPLPLYETMTSVTVENIPGSVVHDARAALLRIVRFDGGHSCA